MELSTSGSRLPKVTSSKSFSRLTLPLAFERVSLLHVLGLEAYRIDDDEVVFVVAVRGDVPQFRRGDGARAAALHLFEHGAALDGAHEEDDFERFNVGSGGDHVHGDGDARIVGSAELAEQVFGLDAARDPLVDFVFVAVFVRLLDADLGGAGAVGDLLCEVVALAELLANDFHDVVGVAVVFGEDEGFGNFRPTWKDVGEEIVTEGADDGANLVWDDDASVEFVGIVRDVLVGQLPADFACLAISVVDLVARVDDAAVLGDECADGVEVEVDVDADQPQLARTDTP